MHFVVKFPLKILRRVNVRRNVPRSDGERDVYQLPLELDSNRKKVYRFHCLSWLLKPAERVLSHIVHLLQVVSRRLVSRFSLTLLFSFILNKNFTTASLDHQMFAPLCITFTFPWNCMYNLLWDVNAMAWLHYHSLLVERIREPHDNAIILLPRNILVYRFFMRHVASMSLQKRTPVRRQRCFMEKI